MRVEPALRTPFRMILAVAAAALLVVAAAPATAQAETATSSTATSSTTPGVPATPDEGDARAAQSPDTTPAAVAPEAEALDDAQDVGVATGPTGQMMTVSPTRDLDPAGATVRVTGEGYDTTIGIYVGLCVDNGPSVAPSPCIGGVDMGGTGGASAWISSNPPPYGVGLAQPFGTGGTFDVTLTVPSSDEFTDCLDGVTRCVISTRGDHTTGNERSADVKVAVTFAGQETEVPEPQVTEGTISLDRTEVEPGGTVVVSGTGFAPGEQVQVWLLSEPQLIGLVAADSQGAVQANVVIPLTTPPGVHHIELRGMSSGMVVRSAAITVAAAAPVDPAPTVPVTPVSAPVSPTASSGTLPATGTASLPLTAVGLAMVLGGLALVRTSRRNLA